MLGGSRLANEDAYAWAKFARTVLRTDNVDAQVGDGLPGDLVASLPRATIDQVCDASLIVTLAPDIKEELPVLYLRLRHAAVEKGVPIIEISPGPTGLSSRATECLHYRPGELSSLVEALCGGTPVKDDIAGIACPAGRAGPVRHRFGHQGRRRAGRDRCRRDRCRRDRCRRDRGRRDRGPPARRRARAGVAGRAVHRHGCRGAAAGPAPRRLVPARAAPFQRARRPGLRAVTWPVAGTRRAGGRPPMVRAPLGGTPARDGRA